MFVTFEAAWFRPLVDRLAGSLGCLAFAFSPASAAMMAWNSANMAKSVGMMTGTPDTPAKMTMNKEMAMANTEISKGNMRGACMHYMKAQKAMK